MTKFKEGDSVKIIFDNEPDGNSLEEYGLSVGDTGVVLDNYERSGNDAFSVLVGFTPEDPEEDLLYWFFTEDELELVGE